MRNLNQIMREADAVMSKIASAEKREDLSDDVIAKLAQELRSDDPAMDENLTVKIAEAFAIVDTIINLETMAKMAAFESKALEAGRSEQEIADFMEKKANLKLISATSLIPWLDKK